MSGAAKLSDLIEPLEVDSPEHHTYFDREQHRIVMVERSVMSAVEESDEEYLAELSDWQKPEIETARAVLEDGRNRFNQPPNKFDFHEYHHMERFIGQIGDESAADQLWRAIKGRGAFRCFKDTLYRLGIQDDWFRYRDEAMRGFARAWAQEHNVPFTER